MFSLFNVVQSILTNLSPHVYEHKTGDYSRALRSVHPCVRRFGGSGRSCLVRGGGHDLSSRTRPLPVLSHPPLLGLGTAGCGLTPRPPQRRCHWLQSREEQSDCGGDDQADGHSPQDGVWRCRLLPRPRHGCASNSRCPQPVGLARVTSNSFFLSLWVACQGRKCVQRWRPTDVCRLMATNCLSHHRHQTFKISSTRSVCRTGVAQHSSLTHCNYVLSVRFQYTHELGPNYKIRTSLRRFFKIILALNYDLYVH